MTIKIYRDTTCTTGHAVLFEAFTRFTTDGNNFSKTAWSNGTTRTAGAGPATATNLNASNAYFVVTHSTGRKISMQRKANSYTWSVQYTDPLAALSAGNASTPDNNATYTQTFWNNAQAIPSSGSMKTYMVIDDVTGAFALFVRKTPLPTGTTACTVLYMDVGGSPLWSADPAPDAVKLLYDASNDAPSTAFLSAQGWWSRGNANEAWATWTLENISRLAGSTQKDPGDVDNEYETRWVSENWTNYPGIAGLSALFRLLNPKLGPTTGLDGGATKTRATFGVVSVPCDGTLPAS